MSLFISFYFLILDDYACLFPQMAWFLEIPFDFSRASACSLPEKSDLFVALRNFKHIE